MAKLKSRVNIAAVILSFADKPLHSNSDLSYMAEVIRAGEDKDPGTPWSTMYSNITTKGWFTLETGSCFSLNVPDGMSKKDFVIEKVTHPFMMQSVKNCANAVLGPLITNYNGRPVRIMFTMV